MKMPATGDSKPCPMDECGGTLSFNLMTPIPGTGGAHVDNETGRGPITEPQAAPAWSCSSCDYIEWMWSMSPQALAGDAPRQR